MQLARPTAGRDRRKAFTPPLDQRRRRPPDGSCRCRRADAEDEIGAVHGADIGVPSARRRSCGGSRSGPGEAGLGLRVGSGSCSASFSAMDGTVDVAGWTSWPPEAIPASRARGGPDRRSLPPLTVITHRRAITVTWEAGARSPARSSNWPNRSDTSRLSSEGEDEGPSGPRRGLVTGKSEDDGRFCIAHWAPRTETGVRLDGGSSSVAERELWRTP